MRRVSRLGNYPQFIVPGIFRDGDNSFALFLLFFVVPSEVMDSVVVTHSSMCDSLNITYQV